MEYGYSLGGEFAKFVNEYFGGRFNHPLGYAELGFWIVMFYVAVFLIIGLFRGSLKPVMQDGTLRIGPWLKNTGMALRVPLVFLALGLVVGFFYFWDCAGREVSFSDNYCDTGSDDDPCASCSGLLVKDADGQGTRWMATMANTYGAVVVGFQPAVIGTLFAALVVGVLWLGYKLLALVTRFISAIWRFTMSYLRRVPISW